METLSRRHPSRLTAGQLLARRQWAQAVLRQHRDAEGTCPACSSGVIVSAWPCLPAKTALIYLGDHSSLGRQTTPVRRTTSAWVGESTGTQVSPQPVVDIDPADLAWPHRVGR